MSIAAEKLPPPRWFSKKCSEFYCHDCIEPEILVLDHQIHSVSGCFTCKHWNSIKFMHFFNVLTKNCAATAPLPRWILKNLSLPHRYRGDFVKNLPLSHRERHGHLWCNLCHSIYPHFHCDVAFCEIPSALSLMVAICSVLWGWGWNEYHSPSPSPSMFWL